MSVATLDGGDGIVREPVRRQAEGFAFLASGLRVADVLRDTPSPDYHQHTVIAATHRTADALQVPHGVKAWVADLAVVRIKKHAWLDIHHMVVN